MQDLARLLRQLRRRQARQHGGAELTYRELATVTGWSLGIISEYFAGNILAPTDRFDDLVRLLGATPAEQDELAAARDRVDERRRSIRAQVAHPRRVVPRQLPLAVRHFAGRAAELKVLTTLAGEAAEAGGSVVISAIDGTAGIGKTAFAVHWAHQVTDRFPDGQVFVNLRGFDPTGLPITPDQAVRGFLNAFGVSPERIPAGLDAQTGLYRSLLAGRRVLVVLDNARDAEQVRPLLPSSPGCLAVVTSRNRLTSLVTAEDAQPLTLHLLPTEEARELLTGRLGPDRVAADPGSAGEIIALCARLPLALSIVAARAAAHPGFSLAALAGELREARSSLDAFDGGDPVTDVRAVFSWSYRALSPAAARLFRLLDLHPGPDLGISAAASLAAVPVPEAGRLLAELARAHMIVEHTPGRYTFHDLLHAYAAELSHTHDTDAARHATTHRVLDHYLHAAHIADQRLAPHRDPIALPPPQPGVTVQDIPDHDHALTWFTTEHPGLLATLRQAASSGFDTHTWQLAWTFATFLQRRGHWHDEVAAGAAAVEAARRLADRRAQAIAHRGLGIGCLRLDRVDDARAHLQRALDGYAELGDHTSQARTHINLAVVFERQRRHGDALSHAQQALELYRETSHRGGQANALNAVGWYHAQLGDHQQALASCQQALTLQRELDDRAAEADTWDSLGYAHRHLGHHALALTCYQHAIDLYRDLGDRYFEADALTRLGDTHHAADDPESARDAWRRALDLLDELDHPDADQVRARLHRDATPAPRDSGSDPGL